jgi:hypothetical protein
MKTPMHFPQPAARHVRVNLRRVDLRMAEQFLDDSQVRSVLQQMRGKAMPQHVRRDVALDATSLDPLFDSQP